MSTQREEHITLLVEYSPRSVCVCVWVGVLQTDVKRPTSITLVVWLHQAITNSDRSLRLSVPK